ncbi:MAG: hypothetical protein HKN88_00075 [Gammaproteobacteria bacterium]|nr:hypothetical protein [Gammaproteobacteria bacterium]NNC96445.1 hypothetical protein [Gammaproteobacteria bacterium]NNM13446.1 hypothetical protein [Gammaproteobacteria bacterium]
MLKKSLLISLGALLLACNLETLPDEKAESLLEEVVMTTYEFSFTVPDPAWTLTVESVLETDQHIAIVAMLDRPKDVMAPQVISEIITKVAFPLHNKPVKVYIKGKQWGWENTLGGEFEDQIVIVDQGFSITGEPVNFELREPSRKSGPKKVSPDSPASEI